jgi:two-component system sensor histidine kinase HydH
LDKVEAGFHALDTTVNDLLHFTSDRDPQWENLRPRQLAEEILASLDPQLAVQQIETIVDVPADLTIHADGVMLRRALLNLVLNALDAMPDGGQLVITSCQGRHGFELEVADSGAGLSPEAKSRAFEPFFTTKPSGTGLGLAIVYRVAEVHGGSVTAANCPEGGAAITIRIPQPAMKAAA